MLKTFVKDLSKLTKTEQILVLETLKLLSSSPSYPSLHTEVINRKYQINSSRVNKDIRIIWQLKGNEIIFLIDVGHHNIYEKYKKIKDLDNLPSYDENNYD